MQHVVKIMLTIFLFRLYEYKKLIKFFLFFFNTTYTNKKYEK